MTDITRLNAMYAATTQGDWQRCQANAGTCQCGLVWSSDLDAVVANCGSDLLVGMEVPKITDEQMVSNSDWVAESHSAWPAIATELTRLREFARRVRASIHFSQTEYGDGREAERDLAWLDAETKKAGE